MIQNDRDSSPREAQVVRLTDSLSESASPQLPPHLEVQPMTYVPDIPRMFRPKDIAKHVTRNSDVDVMRSDIRYAATEFQRSDVVILDARYPRLGEATVNLRRAVAVARKITDRAVFIGVDIDSEKITPHLDLPENVIVTDRNILYMLDSRRKIGIMHSLVTPALAVNLATAATQGGLNRGLVNTHDLAAMYNAQLMGLDISLADISASPFHVRPESVPTQQDFDMVISTGGLVSLTQNENRSLKSPAPEVWKAALEYMATHGFGGKRIGIIQDIFFHGYTEAVRQYAHRAGFEAISISSEDPYEVAQAALRARRFVCTDTAISHIAVQMISAAHQHGNRVVVRQLMKGFGFSPSEWRIAVPSPDMDAKLLMYHGMDHLAQYEDDGFQYPNKDISNIGGPALAEFALS